MPITFNWAAVCKLEVHAVLLDMPVCKAGGSGRFLHWKEILCMCGKVWQMSNQWTLKQTQELIGTPRAAACMQVASCKMCLSKMNLSSKLLLMMKLKQSQACPEHAVQIRFQLSNMIGIIYRYGIIRLDGLIYIHRCKDGELTELNVQLVVEYSFGYW